MDSETRQKLIEFTKDAIDKGYTKEQLMQIMLSKGISERDAKDFVKFAKYSVSSEVPENIFVPKLIVLGSIAVMVGVYVVKIFLFQDVDTNASLFSRLINGFWPLVFPLAANILNFVKYRKTFARGLFISGVAIGLLILLVIVLAMLGL